MILALLLRYWHVAALAALLAFGAFEWHEHNAAEVAKGRAEERARVADSTLKALKPQLARVDTVYRRDTVTLTRTLTKTLALRDTLLLHLTDTLRVKEFIAQSDSAFHACMDVANSCATNLRLKDQQIIALESKLNAQPQALNVRHWYSDRFSVGPYAGIDRYGKGSVGVSAQLSLVRFP